MPDLESQDPTCELCAACQHSRTFHGSNGGPCLAEKILGSQCWCRKYEANLILGIDSVLKYGDPSSLMAASESAIQRGDHHNAARLLDCYIRKTPQGTRDATWITAVQRSITRLQKPELREDVRNPHVSRSEALRRILASTERARTVWNQIAQERVSERLEGLVSRVSLYPLRSGRAGEIYRNYLAQGARSQKSIGKVPSRELEDAIFMLEDVLVEQALAVYEEEIPDRKVSSGALLQLIYSQGLVRFIEEQILCDICFRLAKAQPSLGLNTSRPDFERLLSYHSPRLQKEFSVVLRIVDRLKSHWQSKVSKRAGEIDESNSRGAGGAGEIDEQDSQHLEGSASDYLQESLVLKPESVPDPIPDSDPRDSQPSLKSNFSPQGSPARYGSAKRATLPTPTTWSDIQVVFLSDDRVQIYVEKKPCETMNYADFGFADLRTGNPNLAWEALRTLAEEGGRITNTNRLGVLWSKFEKRVQEIRAILRQYFGISDDPIPYIEGTGYVTQFRIRSGPSYRH
jgi:hypothetical protein